MEIEETRKVGLCVGGGIASYKAIEVMRELQKRGFSVRVALTKHATEFIRPLTFKALTNEPVVVDDYAPDNRDPIAHINFSQEIDLMIVLATANLIGKFANGIADDFVTSTFLACTAPVVLAPAMNTTMYEHGAVQTNLSRLRSFGIEIIDPVTGELACKTVGTGKLASVEEIVNTAVARLSPVQDLKGERFLITVGGTREAIDPVRFISNHSSGKMGFAVARAAAKRGAKVTVVAGVTSAKPPENVKLVRGISAQEMYEAVMKEISGATIFVGAAAVADYRPKNVADAKIKKTAADSITLEFEKTPDILANVAANKKTNQLIVGFAAETNNVVEYAERKLEAKKLDLVVANDVSKPGVGFDSETNSGTIVFKDKSRREIELMPKLNFADRVLDAIVEIRNA